MQSASPVHMRLHDLTGDCQELSAYIPGQQYGAMLVVTQLVHFIGHTKVLVSVGSIFETR
jgi:hypothetical protein